MTERKALAQLRKAVMSDLTATIMADCPLIRIAMRDAELVLEGKPTTAKGLRALAAEKGASKP